MRRKTHAEHVAEIAAKNPNVEIIGEIKNSRTKVLCRCKVCGYEWAGVPDHLKHGCGCPSCAGNKKLSHEEHIAAINKINPNVEVLGKIKNDSTKVLCRCTICNHKWEVRPNDLKRGKGCPECAKIKIANTLKLAQAEQIAAIAKVNPNIEVLGEITRNDKKVLCRCLICRHEWKATPNNIKHGYGCPACAVIKRANARRLTHAEQVETINKINPNIEILGEIKSNGIKVPCRCKICSHEWMTTPDKLKQKHGCPVCAGNTKKNTEEFIKEARAIHSDKYDYSLVEYVNTHKKVKIICPVHGVFEQVPKHHLKGIGCAKCTGKARLTTEEFIKEAKKVHGDKYDYSKVIYRGKHKDVCIICPEHGEFWQNARNHLRNQGCPQCAKRGFLGNDFGKLYIMVDDLNVPTMMKIGVSTQEDRRSKDVLNSAHKAGVIIPALYVAKTWEGPTDLMQRIESMMHENYAEWNIKFPAKFDGCTEFFYYTPETAEAFDVIEETIHEIINGNQAA